MCMEPPCPRQHPVFLPNSSDMICRRSRWGTKQFLVAAECIGGSWVHSRAQARFHLQSSGARTARTAAAATLALPTARLPPRPTAPPCTAHLAGRDALGQRVHVVAVGAADEVVLAQVGLDDACGQGGRGREGAMREGVRRGSRRGSTGRRRPGPCRPHASSLEGESGSSWRQLPAVATRGCGGGRQGGGRRRRAHQWTPPPGPSRGARSQTSCRGSTSGRTSPQTPGPAPCPCRAWPPPPCRWAPPLRRACWPA